MQVHQFMPDEDPEHHDEEGSSRDDATGRREQAGAGVDALSRRRLLAAAGSTATVVGLAGCNGQSIERQEFESKPVHLGADGLHLGGYRSGSHEANEQSRSRTIGGQDVEVSITSHVTTYAVDGAAEDPPRGVVANRLPLGILTTPSATVLGQQLNPLLAASAEQLLTGNRGRQLLALSTPLDGDFEWVAGPAKLDGARETTVFDAAATVQPFTGVVEGSSGREAVVVYLARTTRESDAVISAAVKRVPVDDEFRGPVVRPSAVDADTDAEVTDTPTPDGEGGTLLGRGTSFAFHEVEVLGPQYSSLVDLHEHLEVGPPLVDVSPPPDVTPSDLRLVQAVEETKVTTSPPNRASQHDMVAGDNTAAVFDPSVGGSGSTSSRFARLPGHVRVETEVHRNGGSDVHTTRVGRSDLKEFVTSGDDHRKVWTELARENLGASATTSWSCAPCGGVDDLSVFELPRDVQRVTVSIKTPIGVSLGSETVAAGQDFEVASQPELKVGFIMVEDPGGGSNYGSNNAGLPQDYYGHVENCVDYLRSTFPGRLAAYRSGRWWIGGKKRKITKNSGFLGLGSTTVEGMPIDHRNAKKELGKLRSNSRFFKDGDLYTHGMSKAAAKRKIRNDGFDCVVLVTPGTDPGNNAAVATPGSPYGSYYDYHQNDKQSDPGNTRTLGKMFYDHRLAVGGLDYEDPWLDGVGAAATTAQELSHYFIDKPYKGVGGSNHPFAQRGSGGQDATVGGNPVDFDHARDLSPGVVSVGYDLADGTFQAANDPQTNNSPGPIATGELVQNDFGSSSLSTYESFMSYTNNDTWTDSVIYQALLEFGYEWRCHYTDDLCVASRISAEGTEPADTDQEGDERERGEMLTAVGVVEDDGSVTVVDYELVDTAREPPEAGDAIEVDLLDGVGGESLASETHPAAIGSHHASLHPQDGGHEYPMVLIALPFEDGTTHLRTAGEGEPRVDNAIRGVVGAALARLDDEAMGEETAADLRERLDELEALVDERQFAAARDLLGDLRTVVAERVEQREPVQQVEGVGEMRDAAATTRDDVLDQVDRLREHLEAMA